MSYRDELKELLRRRSLVIGDIILSSGKKSNYYLDCKLTTLNPRGAYLTGQVILEVLSSNRIEADAIGGLSMGADPIVSAVAVVSHLEGKSLPGFLIRKEPKKHGRMKHIEGLEKGIKKVVIVDEVCTTGKSTQEAIDAAVSEGYTVVAVISLVDREEGGSRQLKSKYNYHAVFTASELLSHDDDKRSADSAGEFPQPARPETALHK
jgi:orotate phosphoribosyltransferase